MFWFLQMKRSYKVFTQLSKNVIHDFLETLAQGIHRVTMFILQSVLAQYFFRTLPNDSFWGSNYLNLFLKSCFVSIS